ncbi:MAG: 3'-5' exonuclease domain-containing protein 2 [Pseudomonadota bacterium]|nr:3'-5' exonuclease domain-containing protein 2 [Pseudomonadota bacterium]
MAELPRTISREDVIRLPIRRCELEVVLIESQEKLDRAMADLRQERVVGLDTETRPAFRKGEVHLPALVQVGASRAVYLFPLQRMDFSAALAELMAAPGIVKAGVSLAHDLKQLKLLFPFEQASVVDLGIVARRSGMEQTGVRNLAAIFLGYRIPKGNKTSNWAAKRLTDAQITYAATDAWVCRELYLRFAEMGLL